MDLTLDQATLSRALRLIARVVPTRSTLPILQTVLLAAEAGRLRLTATDGELALATAVAANVTTLGRAAIPARLLGEYVAQLPTEPLRLALDESGRHLRARCGRFAATLAAANPEDFPVLPAADESATVDLDARRLRRAIDRVAFAAARDASRPVLTAVLFDFGPDGLTLAAADGFRLARARLPEAAGAGRQLLVPARAVAELGRLLAEAEVARLILTPDEHGAFLSVGETTLFARLIDGAFPDVERVIPRDARTRVTVDAVSFRQAVRVAGLFGSDGQVRPVVLEAGPERLHLLSRGDEVGEAESELPATVEGDHQAVALNTRLLIDLLESTDGSRLELSWSSPQAPVLVREADAAGSDDVWVVMPLHDPALTRPQAQAA
ncbi:MAG: DNA polymerase III subunit beta [Chloroflexi bacterium]|nr:DNA polymerase III subunit beta [Chloroflexota bacterium]